MYEPPGKYGQIHSPSPHSVKLVIDSSWKSKDLLQKFEGIALISLGVSSFSKGQRMPR